MAKIPKQNSFIQLAAQVNYVLHETGSHSYRVPVNKDDMNPIKSFFNRDPGSVGKYILTVEASPAKLDKDGLADGLKYEIIFTKR